MAFQVCCCLLYHMLACQKYSKNSFVHHMRHYYISNHSMKLYEFTLFLFPLPAFDLIPVSPSEFSFELPLGNVRTFFICHPFWSQGVSQLQGDGVQWWMPEIMLHYHIVFVSFRHPTQCDCLRAVVLLCLLIYLLSQ